MYVCMYVTKIPKNTDISPILGIKFSTKIVQKGYDYIFSLFEREL